MARMTLCCGQEMRARLRSRKRPAQARKMSATSRAGRLMMRPAPDPLRVASWESIQRIGRSPQFAGRKVQINHGVAGIGVAQQGLNDGQLGAAVQQMGGEAVAERMRMNAW